MTRTAALLLLLVVGCSKTDNIPADFGAGSTKVGEWDMGREVWVRIDDVTHTEGNLWIEFTVTNKAGVERGFPISDYEVTIKDL